LTCLLDNPLVPLSKGGLNSQFSFILNFNPNFSVEKFALREDDSGAHRLNVLVNTDQILAGQEFASALWAKF